MTRMEWGNVGERFYETGVDRGVLYIAGIPGVPWNGLTAVNQSSSGGEAVPHYIDGYKYANLAAAEEFEATIEAYSSPAEFARCDGTNEISNGLFATQQPRTAFGFSYRTRIGSDVNGIDHGYKIHLVYNALAAPADRSHSTINDSVDPNTLSWSISTLSPLLSGYRPTAHFVIDSRSTVPDRLVDIENILYGNDVNEPRLPSAAELVTLFQSTRLVGEWLNAPGLSASVLKHYLTGEVVRTNYALNPSFEINILGTSGMIVEPNQVLARVTTDGFYYVGAAALRVTLPSDIQPYEYVGCQFTVAPGEYVAASFMVRSSGGAYPYRARVLFYNVLTLLSTAEWGPLVTGGNGEWVEVNTAIAQAPANTDRVRVYLYQGDGNASSSTPSAVYTTDAWRGFRGATKSEIEGYLDEVYFDGDSRIDALTV